MARIVVYGASPVAALAQTYLDAGAAHEVVAFAVSGSASTAAERTGLPIIDPAAVRSAFPPGEHAMFIAPDPLMTAPARLEVFDQALADGYELVSYVSPSATVWPEAMNGRNYFILERVVVQPWVELRDDVTLWSGCHVGHETVIEEHCFLAARTVVSGNVNIKPGCYLGPNSSVRDAITLGEGTQVGAGVTLRKSTEPGAAYVATPSSAVTAGPPPRLDSST